MQVKLLRAMLGVVLLLPLAGNLSAQGFVCEECYMLLCIPVGDGGFANCFIDEEEVCEYTFNPISGGLELICVTEYTCMNTEFCGSVEEPPPCV